MAQVTFTIDGRKVTCEKGTMVLQAALDAGIFVPHYCYHPALSVAGNCRMCMVEIVPKPPPNAAPGWKPPPQKPAIACATEAADGMEVLSERSAMAKAAREGVLEFLLINHPLDCPVCDQAGECDLQDFSFQFGRATSRFNEQKETKGEKDFGPEVRLYGNRCINCTRCVRFSQEISGGAEIAQVNRGDRNVVDIYPGKAFDNALSGNVVDICPVGALVSRDFLHKARVWQLDTTPSVCPHCSTGCSVEVHTRDDVVQRLKPRLNPEVNGFWMCDTGRLGYKFVEDERRLLRFERRRDDAREALTFKTALDEVASELEAAKGAAFALASAWMTNEELHLLAGLMEPGHVILQARSPWKEQRFHPHWGDSLRNPSLPGQQARGARYPDGATFVVESDRNPNRRGAERILGGDVASGEEDGAFVEACERGEVKALLVFSGIPDHEPPAALLRALEKVPFVAVCDVLPGPLVDRAHLVLPGATFAEKEGTFTNGRGTTQRFLFSRPPPGHARPELEILHGLGLRMGKAAGSSSARAVFETIVRDVEGFEGMSWDGLAPRSPAWSPHYLGEPGHEGAPAAEEPRPAAARVGG